MDFVFAESPFATEIPESLDGDNLAKGLTQMAGLWGALVGNTNTLLRLTQTTRRFEQENKKERADVGLAYAEFVTSLLATKVGERPQKLGTESIFSLLEELVEDMERCIIRCWCWNLQSLRHHETSSL
jgi:hypothetical protein